MEEYSASATTVSFDRPVPLLRGPVPGGGSESGQYVLAFRSLDSWAAAYKRCETQIEEQCEEGARIGCAVSASNNCKPPWWRSLGGAGLFVDMREREKCEEREFKECLGAAKNKCSGFAKEKCSAAFLDARIAVEMVEGLVWLASMREDSRWLGSLVQARRSSKTYRRARDVLLLNQQQKLSQSTF